jgi:hypothetical protein
MNIVRQWESPLTLDLSSLRGSVDRPAVLSFTPSPSACEYDALSLSFWRLSLSPGR